MQMKYNSLVGDRGGLMFSDAVQYAARAMRTMGRRVGPVLQDISCLYGGGVEIQELKASLK